MLSRYKLTIIDFGVCRGMSRFLMLTPQSNLAVPRHEVLIQLEDGSQFTSIDKDASLRQADFRCLCTTRQLIWIDESSRKESLRWDHDFGGGSATDIDLVAIPDLSSSEDDAAAEVVMLSSLSVDYIQGIKLATRPQTAVVTLPWCLPTGGKAQSLQAISSVSYQSDGPASSEFFLIAQYLDGSVALAQADVNACTQTDPSVPIVTRQRSHWSPGLSELEDEYLRTNMRVDEVAATRYQSLHGRWVWHGEFVTGDPHALRAD